MGYKLKISRKFFLSSSHFTDIYYCIVISFVWMQPNDWVR